jgi:hypothetical protein
MNCDDVLLSLPQIFDGQLPEPFAIALQLHLQHCAVCREVLTQLLLLGAVSKIARSQWGQPLSHLA